MPNDKPMTAPKITPEQRDQFNAMRRSGNVGLMSGFYDDKPALIVFAKHEDPNDSDSVILEPLAVMVTQDILDHLKDCTGTPLPKE